MALRASAAERTLLRRDSRRSQIRLGSELLARASGAARRCRTGGGAGGMDADARARATRPRCLTCAGAPRQSGGMVQLMTPPWPKSSLRSYRGYLATSPWNPHPRLHHSFTGTGASWRCAPLMRVPCWPYLNNADPRVCLPDGEGEGPAQPPTEMHLHRLPAELVEAILEQGLEPAQVRARARTNAVCAHVHVPATSADTHICARAHTYIYAYTRPALAHRVSRRGAQGQ